MIEGMSPPKDGRERAMALIRGRARGTDFEAFTQRLWLEEHGS